MKHLIAPSLLSANFLRLEQEIEMVNQSQADWFHIDIMDGIFVPNISFGFSIMKQIKNAAQKPLDVHLMITQPERYLKDFKEAGANYLSVHFEASTHLHRSIQQIKELGMKAGVVLNPHNNVMLLENIIMELDLVCIMSVNPGFGGQKFIPHSLEKINHLRQLIDERNSNALIEVDGGVDDTNAKKLINAGANVLVAGSYVFNSENPIKTIEKLKNLEE